MTSVPCLWELGLKNFPVVNSLPQLNNSIQLDVHILLPSQCCLPPWNGAEILKEDTQTAALREVVLGGVETHVDFTDKRTRQHTVKDQICRQVLLLQINCGV